MSLELKLDEGLCRCCHAQGMFQNLSTPFVCQGQEEIYSEMLRECFNVIITPLEGEYSTSTYTICITCALKLRDANEFKKQVLECEERFKEVCKEVMKSLEPMDIDIKVEIGVAEVGDQAIKEEQSYDDDMDAGVEDDYEVKSEESKDETDELSKSIPTQDNKAKGRKLRVASTKGKPAVKVKRQNRIGMPRRQKKRPDDSTTNETDSTRNKSTAVSGTRKKIAEKKTLADKSYKKENDRSSKEITLEVPETVPLPSAGKGAPEELNCHPEKKISRRTISERGITKKCTKEQLNRSAKNQDIQDQILRVDDRIADETQSRYMCITCEKFFTTEEGCVRHIRRTHTEALVSCPLCEAKFRLETYKRQHLALNHHVEEIRNGEATVLVDCLNKFECDICGKKFNTRNSVKYHIKYHLSKQCRHCGLLFDTVVEVTDHLYRAHGEHIPTCGICGYKNRVKSLVMKHQRKVHMKEKNVKCELCGESFFSSRYLSRHMIKHNPEKKYECQYCLKKFPRMNTLRQHVKIHMGLKNKVCQVCDERFVQKASLNYHMTKYHPDVKF